MKKFIGTGLKPEGPNLNVLNILRTLIESGDTVIYIPDHYKYGSKSYSKDPLIHMFPKESGMPVRVLSISSNQERFNFSLVGLVDIVVEVQSDYDETVSLVHKKVFRQYTVIRDGELAMEYVVAKLNQESFDDLKAAKLLYYNGVIVPENHMFSEDFLYKIDFSGIPVISLNWAQPIKIGLYKNLVEEEYLMESVSALKKIIKEYKDQGMVPTVNDRIPDIYNEKRTDKGVRIHANSLESFEVGCIVYRLVDNKVIEISIEALKDMYPTIDSAITYRDELNKRLKSIRFLSRSIIMAIEMSNKKGSYEWSEKQPLPRSKNKFIENTVINVNGEDVILQRLSYIKKIDL